MIERCEHLRLATKAVQRVRVRERIAVYSFHRNESLQCGLPGQQHFTAATGADLTDKVVALGQRTGAVDHVIPGPGIRTESESTRIASIRSHRPGTSAMIPATPTKVHKDGEGQSARFRRV